jgi:hypothetical protein
MLVFAIRLAMLGLVLLTVGGGALISGDFVGWYPLSIAGMTLSFAGLVLVLLGMAMGTYLIKRSGH